MLLFVPLTIGCETLSTPRYAQPLQPLAGAEVERTGISASENTVSNATQRLSDLACPAGRRNLSRSLLLGIFASLRHLLHSCTTLVPGCPESNPSLPAPQSQIQRLLPCLRPNPDSYSQGSGVCYSFYLVTLSGQFAYPVNSASIFREVAQAMITLRKVSGFVSRLGSSGISL